MGWMIYAFGSALFAALVAILGKIGVSGINSNLATAIRTVVILIFAWGIVLAQGTYKDIGAIPKHTLIFLILSGIATGISWLLYFRALQIGNASQVAPIDKFSLVLTIIFAIIFLKEKITGWGIFGTILITIGTIIVAIAK